ncbi:MAG TPA: DHH family phosphoesterase [Methanocorpusculum sp.]|nr:DHH family phosphoesterase [Methanocorpusculum sp.]
MEIVPDIKRAVERIRSAEKITVISHIDADGIASASIMLQAIKRECIPVVSVFVRQLEPLTIQHIPHDNSLKLFTDLGSGQQNLLEQARIPPEQVLILDHHIAQDPPNGTRYFQVNAQQYGEDYKKCSAAGICYLVALNMNPNNYDLAKLSIVGNVGDMMARESCRLVGIVHWIAEDAERKGVLTARTCLNCYGLSTRALHLCLSNCDDPVIPGISGNPQAAVSLLCKMGIYADEHDNRTFEDLIPNEVKTLSSQITEQMIANGEDTERLFSEQYFFPDEIEHTPLRNASEYATMLNACGRWAIPYIGAAVCAGDRGANYHEAEHMLRHHKSIIRELCEYILETGVTEHSAIQSIHTGNKYPDTIVGIGAGLALSKLNRDKPILILSEVSGEPEIIKVSMRTNEMAVRRGVNLQEALCSAASIFGGEGGGHNIAAGAYIPKGCEDDFIRKVNELIEAQLTAHTEKC